MYIEGFNDSEEIKTFCKKYNITIEDDYTKNFEKGMYLNIFYMWNFQKQLSIKYCQYITGDRIESDATIITRENADKEIINFR